MVKITPDLISRSAQYLNPVKEFQLDLRGYKIAAIENLSATNDQFGCIDLSDNSISRLEDLPKLNRLRTILLINNRIMKIDRDFALNCPNLENLIMTNNRVSYQFYLLRSPILVKSIVLPPAGP
jgi:U2 small nuclear ribonucleoprotein A'